jgi:hypothetical protein
MDEFPGERIGTAEAHGCQCITRVYLHPSAVTIVSFSVERTLMMAERRPLAFGSERQLLEAPKRDYLAAALRPIRKAWG